uniref:protein S100-P n=1 Tax=Jaculus jaculus TaxID=51337 RepID=UPI0003330772|nr:protein S100-P [Jaculus jaculus]
MTELETAIGIIISVFNRYATNKVSKRSLTKAELKSLIQKELPCLMQTRKDTKDLEKLLKDLDSNKDTQVDFNEFIAFVAALTSACHHHFPWKNSE